MTVVRLASPFLMRFHSLPLSCALALSLSYSFSMWVRVAQRASNVCLYSGGSEAAFGQGASGSPLTPPHRTEAGWKVNGPGAGACGTWKRAQRERERERERLAILHISFDWEMITCHSWIMHMVYHLRLMMGHTLITQRQFKPLVRITTSHKKKLKL